MSHFYTGVNDVQFILFIRLLPFFSSLLTQPFEWLLHLFCSHCFLFQGCSIWRNQTWRPANYESTCMCLYPLCLCRHKTGYANYSYNQDTELAAECGNNYSKIFNLNSTSSSGANSGGGMSREQSHKSPKWLCVFCCSITQRPNRTHWAIWTKPIWKEWKWLSLFPGSTITGNLNVATVIKMDKTELFCICFSKVNAEVLYKMAYSMNWAVSPSLQYFQLLSDEGWCSEWDRIVTSVVKAREKITKQFVLSVFNKVINVSVQ